MAATALQSIEAELDRLERQRLGYALALASSQDNRARSRHERTLRRLDEEIAALQEAAGTLVHASAPNHGVPRVNRTAEFDAEAYDELVATPTRRWVWPVVVAALGVVAVAGWWATRPAPAPVTEPSAAPASVIITSPVPPDSHR